MDVGLLDCVSMPQVLSTYVGKLQVSMKEQPAVHVFSCEGRYPEGNTAVTSAMEWRIAGWVCVRRHSM